MNNKDEALKQAIAWADFHGEDVFAGAGWRAVKSMNEWRAKCAEALAQPEPVTPTIPQQEPVWIQRNHLQQAQRAPFFCRLEPTQRWPDFVPLYTHPPQRKPLPEEGIWAAYQRQAHEIGDK